MPDTNEPQPSVQGASSNRQEEINMPASSPPADLSVSVEVRENLLVSSGDKEIAGSSSTLVEKESIPANDRPLGVLVPPVDEKFRGRGTNKKPPPKNVTPPPGGIIKQQHSKSIQEEFKHVRSKISFNK